MDGTVTVCACVRYQGIEKDVIMLKKKVSELPFHR